MQCKICGQQGEYPQFFVREMMFGTRERFEYFQCSQCHCLQLAAIPSDLGHYYPQEYYSFKPCFENAANWKNRIVDYLRTEYMAACLTLRASLLLRYPPGRWLGKIIEDIYPMMDLRSLLNAHINRQMRILDVGCGNGGTLYYLREHGLDNLLGIDPFLSDQEVKYSNGLTLKKQALHETVGTWDVIMLNHSLEHMPGQHEAMQKIAELLSPRGIGIVRIPVVASYAWEHYRENWMQLDAPRHLFLHSPDSIASLGREHGLEVELLDYDSTAAQFLGSEQYCQDIPLFGDKRSFWVNPSSSIFTSAAVRAYRKQAVALNCQSQGDQAVFYLRHKELSLA